MNGREQRQIAGMDPIAFTALIAFTLFLICVGVNSGDEPADPRQDPFPTVSTK